MIGLLMAAAISAASTSHCRDQGATMQFMATNNYNVLASGKGSDGKKYVIFYHAPSKARKSDAIILTAQGNMYCPVVSIADVFSDFDLSAN